MQDKATHQASLAAKQEHVNALLTTITELTQKIADVDAQILSHTNNIRDLNALNEQTADALIGDIDQLISIHQSLKAAHDQAVAEVNDVVQQFPQDNEHIKALLAAIRDQVCSCKEGRF